MSEVKYSPKYWQETIDEIMDNFDFDKVHRCMIALDWKWDIADCKGIPDIVDLRRMARRLLRECVDKNEGSTGGFAAGIDRDGGCLWLSFVVENWDAYKEAECNSAQIKTAST